MTKGRTRLGNAGQGTGAGAGHRLDLWELEQPQTDELMSTNYRGPSPPQVNEVNFSQWKNTPLIFTSRELLFEEIFQNRSAATINIRKKELAFIERYIAWWNITHSPPIEAPKQINSEFTHSFLVYTLEMRGRLRKLLIFRRFLKALCVDPSLIPNNIETAQDAKPRDTFTPAQTRRVYNLFKAEATIVVDRLRERDTLLPLGHDPRRAFGGRLGDWLNPAHRLYLLTEVIGLHFRPINDLRREGHRTTIAGMERYPGAMTLRLNGIHRRKSGVTGHLRWFFPSQRDLLPFIVLLLLRTNFNGGTVMVMRLGKFKLRPTRLKSDDVHDNVYRLSTPKFRGGNVLNAEPQQVHAMSFERPWAHPYRVIKFLVRLTHPLRQEIKRQIRMLRTMPRLTSEQEKYLDYLLRIRNDLFIYFSNGRISSLADQVESPNFPKFTKSFEALDLPTNLQIYRDSGLANGFNFANRNVTAIQIMASHSSKRSSRPYQNRHLLKRAAADLFIEIFDKSIALIEVRAFDKKTLAAILSRDGFSKAAIDTILSLNSLTYWGSHCSTPFDPPKEFAFGTLPGQACSQRGCILGCPRGRWFSDARETINQRLNELKRKRATLPFVVTANSRIHEEIEHCETIWERLTGTRHVS